MTRRRLKILVTGFGPFPGVRINPTEGLARRLAQSRRFARLGAAVELHIFPTRWATVARELPLVWSRTKPDAALHLGVAPSRRIIAVETIARPAPALRSPDAGGKIEHRNASGSASRNFRIAAPAQPLLAALRRAGASSRLSNNAGRYLCNALYHQSLSLRANAREARPTVFIHVPMRARGRASLPLARVKKRKPGERAMLKGLEEAMLVLLKTARRA